MNFGGRSKVFLMRSQDTAPLLCRDRTRGRQQPHQHSLQWHPEPSRAWLLDHLLRSAPVEDQDIHKLTVSPTPFPPEQASRVLPRPYKGLSILLSAVAGYSQAVVSLHYLEGQVSDPCWDVPTCSVLLSSSRFSGLQPEIISWSNQSFAGSSLNRPQHNC